MEHLKHTPFENEKIIGNNPESEKEEILTKREAGFYNGFLIKNGERRKTGEDLRIIDLSSQMSDKILEEYGLPKIEVPERIIHIIEEQGWPPYAAGCASFFDARELSVNVRDTPFKMELAKHIVHEMIHLKSFHVFRLYEFHGEPFVYERSVGINCVTFEGKKLFFNLDEAITEELAIKICQKMFGEKIFKKENDETKKIMNSNPRSIIDVDNSPKNQQDIYAVRYLGNNKDSGYLKRVIEALKRDKAPKEVEKQYFSYPVERKILNILIDKILMSGENEFFNRDQVFNEFAKAMLTGNVRKVIKLIDDNFGTGTAQKIEKLENNADEQLKLVEALPLVSKK